VGGADWMAYNKLSYEKSEDVKKYEALIEKISYWCYEASIELAKEKGSYPAYEMASYNTMFGKTPQELNKLSPNGLDWVALIDRIKHEGIRNFLLLAIAPNTSTGILMGAVANYLPPQDKFNIQTLANLSVPIIPRYLKTRFWYYKSKFNYKPEVLINVTKELQRWVDTGISMEVAINTNIANMKDISDAILSGFKNKELKAVYYSLSINGDKAGCSDCAN
jgi:ribonucleoside-diphosphate reductase alpha chain